MMRICLTHGSASCRPRKGQDELKNILARWKQRKLQDKTTAAPMSTGGMSYLRQLLVGSGGSDLSEVTYLTCLKTLSEAMGKLPVSVENGNHEKIGGDVARLLSVAPNSRQTAAEFFWHVGICQEPLRQWLCIH